MAGQWSSANPGGLGGNLLLIQERFLLGKELSWLGCALSHGPISPITAG